MLCITFNLQQRINSRRLPKLAFQYFRNSSEKKMVRITPSEAQTIN